MTIKIRIVSSTGLDLETFSSTINPIGSSTITTKDASYYPTEFSVDYAKNEIVVHVSDDIMYF